MSEFELEYYEMKEKYENLEKEFISYKNTSEEFEIELENQNRILSEQLNTLNKEITNSRNDMKKLKEKNLEKLKEIELYEKDIEKQKHLVEKITEEKSRLEKRIVLLENDNSDYMNKIRELECWSEELRRKLDSTLEENIVQNNEFELYKLEMEETIQRLKEELEDAKNEITSKETIIERMTKKIDNLVKTSCEEDKINNENNTKKFLKSCRSFKKIHKMGNSTGDIFIPTRFSLFESKVKNPLLNKDGNIQNKFSESFSKSCLEIMEQDGEKEKEKEKVMISFEKEEVHDKEIETKMENSLINKSKENDGGKDDIQLEKQNDDIKSYQFVNDKEKDNFEKEGKETKNILNLTLDENSEYTSVNITPNYNKRLDKDPQLDVDDMIYNSIAEKTKKTYIYSNSHTPGNIATPLNLNTPTKDKDPTSNLHFNFRSNLTWNENVEDEREFIRNKIEMEIQNILDNRKVFMQQALIQENFSLDFLSNKINSNCIPSPNKNLTNMNKDKLLKNIDDMLSKIQERKEKLISQKKFIDNKIDKVGLKIF